MHQSPPGSPGPPDSSGPSGPHSPGETRSGFEAAADLHATDEGRGDDPRQDPLRNDVAVREAGAAQAFGMACHLAGLLTYVFESVWFNLPGLIGPLLLWQLLEARHKGAVRAAKEAVQFQLNVLAWLLLAGLLTPICGIGHFVGFVVHAVNVVLILAAAANTAEGERYRYPLTLRVLD